jgi:hypothetical protein
MIQFRFRYSRIQNNRGFIQGTILKDRSAFCMKINLLLALRETNTSFVDFVIRPWVIMASHLVMVARDMSDLPGKINKNPKS